MIGKLFALVLLVDGALTALARDRYLRWLQDTLPAPVPDFAAWLETWPEGLLRGGGAVQALLGLWLFARR
jgi:hypothetical protein